MDSIKQFKRDLIQSGAGRFSRQEVMSAFAKGLSQTYQGRLYGIRGTGDQQDRKKAEAFLKEKVHPQTVRRVTQGEKDKIIRGGDIVGVFRSFRKTKAIKESERVRIMKRVKKELSSVGPVQENRLKRVAAVGWWTRLFKQKKQPLLERSGVLKNRRINTQNSQPSISSSQNKIVSGGTERSQGLSNN